MRRVIDNAVDHLDVDEAMRIAIGAARYTYPHPNPRVGAVILTADGAVRSVGSHIGPGHPHAEVDAIDREVQPDDTMVVTLEPCSHTGRTPPCTEAIIGSGIRRVVVGAIDPDHRVSGSGVGALRDAGIDVVTGVLEREIEAMDPGYFHHRRTGRARITLKLASTLDGQVAAVDGTSRWITSEAAREDAHRLRSENDAVLVGAGTVIADDPTLTVRIPGYVGHQPRPVVVAGSRPIASTSTVLARDALVYESHTGVDLAHVVRDLPRQGILTALVEGGPTIARSFLQAGLVDEIVWYVGAKLAGGTGLPAVSGVFATIGDATDVEITSVERIGGDIKVTAIPSQE